MLKLTYNELRRRLRENLPLQRKRYTQLAARVDAQFARFDAQIQQLNSELEELRTRADAVSDILLDLPNPADSVPVTATVPLRPIDSSELCLFVTFAPDPSVKSHVLEHVRCLMDHGIDVVLIVNTGHSREQFSFDPDFAARLSGCLIRANSGFDFAAWAHAYSLLKIERKLDRIYLVNDSIVGPLQPELYGSMLARVRDSTADLLGLTENSKPQPHLQSYFLVVGRRLLLSQEFHRLMRGVVNMATKQGVIAQYETQLTRFLRNRGYRCEALFPRLSRDPNDKFRSNDTINEWARLIELGFPFVKAEVLRTLRNTPDIARLLPERYRPKVGPNENDAGCVG